MEILDKAITTTGYISCLIHLTIVFVSLCLSFFIRYRKYLFTPLYKNRASPKHYAFLTALPYEAVGIFFLCLPQIYHLGRAVSSAVLENGAWQNLSVSLVGYLILGEVLTLDVLERRLFISCVINHYMETKLQTLLPTMKEKGLVIPVVSISSTTSTTNAANKWESLKSYFARSKAPQPTAQNTLAQHHILAFLKALFLYIFLVQCGTILRVTSDPAMIFNGCYSDLPSMLVVCTLYMFRFGQLCWASRSFARSESGWRDDEVCISSEVLLS